MRNCFVATRWQREKGHRMHPHALMVILLLGLLLFIFLPWQIALPLYVPIVVVSLIIGRKGMLAQRQPPVSGREVMVGDRAVVTSVTTDEVEVHYRGETWRAVSSEPLHPGQPVIIEAVEGLTLQVSPQTEALPIEDGGA
jgi:membrane-bound serine protease (ClpP class)